MDVQILAVTSLIGILITVMIYISKIFNNDKELKNAQEEDVQKAVEKNRKKSESGVSGTKKSGKSAPKEKNFEHPWLLTSLKGHRSDVLAIGISPNDKYLASTCDDRSLILWPTKHFSNKDHKSSRGNVAYDHGAHLKWSPDSKAVILHKETSRQFEVYKMSKKEGSDNYTIQPSLELNSFHPLEDDIIALDMDSNGKFIMTCSQNKNDLVIFDLKGSLLARIDTKQMTTYFACISPCGKYVSACGFTPDVKVWHVKMSKSGGFEKISTAFGLTQHTSGVYHMAWRNDSAKVATISKDGTWCLYNINSEFNEAKLCSNGKVDALPDSKVALSPDGKVMAISRDKNILLYSLEPKADFVKEIELVHNSPIIGLIFDAESRWLISAGDKHIRVFHNVIGFKNTLIDLKKTLEEAVTEGHKDRLKQQIQELTKKLKSIEK